MTYQAVGDPSAASSKLVPQRDYLLPFPAAANAPPVYPESLLHLGLEEQEVVVRLVIGEQGWVTEIQPSPVPSKANPAYRALFETSIAGAVQGWRFVPAKLRTFADGADLDGDGRPDYVVLKDEKPVKSYIDVRFVFGVRAGKPVVTAGH